MPTLQLNFVSPDTAEKFANRFGIIGLRSEVITEGCSVVVRTDDAKSASFVKQMARDITEDIKAERAVQSLMRRVSDSAVNDIQVELELMDGSSVRMESAFARRFLILHEKLGDEARRNICFVAIQDRHSHTKAVDFVMSKCD